MPPGPFLPARLRARGGQLPDVVTSPADRRLPRAVPRVKLYLPDPYTRSAGLHISPLRFLSPLLAGLDRFENSFSAAPTSSTSHADQWPNRSGVQTLGYVAGVQL